MPRDLPIGNGRLLINFDREYNIRDIYYPYVGKANHSHRCVSRTGIWVDGQFSWMNSSEWTKQMKYASDTLATNVIANHEKFKLRLAINDVVDFNRDIFLRKVEIFNLAPAPRNVRIFFHFDFQFWEVGRGDSIQYDPFDNALIAYKDNCYFLMNASLEGGVGPDSWTTGDKDENGKGGSWPDAEDGVLEKNGASFGSVDGVIAVNQPNLEPHSSSVIYSWLVAAQNSDDVRHLDYIVGQRQPQYFIDRTVNYWRAWVNKEQTDLHQVSDDVAHLYRQSLLITRAHVDERGGILAGNDSDLSEIAHGLESYSYVWPRDGGYIANALDKAGYAYLAANFYDFCKDVIHKGQNISNYYESHELQAYMLHKYTPDRLAASNWMPMVDGIGGRHLPIQEDETALIPYFLWQHWRKFRDFEALKSWYLPLAIQTGNFMTNFREPTTNLPAPSFDLWEEQRAIYSYTVATVWAGLNACAEFAELFGEQVSAAKFRSAAVEIKAACETHLYDEKSGQFLKSVSVAEDGTVEADDTVDASLYALWHFGMFDPADPRIERTMMSFEEQLACRTDVGGFARYKGDEYHWDSALDHRRNEIPGNPWVICNLWLAQYKIAVANTIDDLGGALPILDWVVQRALPSGVLAEQYHPLTGESLGVSPLAWSHATFVATVHEYIEKYEYLTADD